MDKGSGPTIHDQLETSSVYSADTVTRSEHKVSKPLKGANRADRVKVTTGGGTGGKGGISVKTVEIGKNTKGRGNRGMAPWAPRGKNAEGPSKKLGASLDCGLKVFGWGGSAAPPQTPPKVCCLPAASRGPTVLGLSIQ